MRDRNLGLALAVGAVALGLPTAALAHPPPLGVPGFFGGVLHPAFVPAHLMASLALGLLIGQQAPRWGRAACACFILALAAGLGVLRFGIAPTWTGEFAMLAALIGGALVALARPLPEALGCAWAAVTGLAIGLDSPPEALSLREADLMLAGTALGGALLLVATAEVARRMTRRWMRIGARVLGAWIAAGAMLALAVVVGRS